MQDWKPSVPKAEPMHNPADTPDAHAESSQPSPHDLPAVGIQNPSDAVSGLLSVPGPPQDPPSAPEHNIPLLQGPDPVDTLPSAPPAQGQLAAGNQQSSMQQLQAALSAQAQVSVQLLPSEAVVTCCACQLWYTRLLLWVYACSICSGHGLKDRISLYSQDVLCSRVC